MDPPGGRLPDRLFIYRRISGCYTDELKPGSYPGRGHSDRELGDDREFAPEENGT
jgi:hypothetical protein